MIYFNPETQRRLVERFATLINPGGYLIIGHSESLHGVTDIFEPLGKTIYRLKSSKTPIKSLPSGYTPTVTTRAATWVDNARPSQLRRYRALNLPTNPSFPQCAHSHLRPVLPSHKLTVKKFPSSSASRMLVPSQHGSRQYSDPVWRPVCMMKSLVSAG